MASNGYGYGNYYAPTQPQNAFSFSNNRASHPPSVTEHQPPQIPAASHRSSPSWNLQDRFRYDQSVENSLSSYQPQSHATSTSYRWQTPPPSNRQYSPHPGHSSSYNIGGQQSYITQAARSSDLTGIASGQSNLSQGRYEPAYAPQVRDSQWSNPQTSGDYNHSQYQPPSNTQFSSGIGRQSVVAPDVPQPRNDRIYHERSVSAKIPKQNATSPVSERVSTESSTTTVDPSLVYDASHEYRHQPSSKKQSQNDSSKGQTEVSQSSERKRKRSKADQRAPSEGESAVVTAPAVNSGSPGGSDLEKQMREMFARMREFNQQDPNLLSRLWHEEREAFLTKQSHADSGAGSKTDAQPSKPKQTKPQEPPKKDTNSSATTTISENPPKPAQPPYSAAAPQFKPEPKKANRSTTVWPAGKKAAIAAAAAELLKVRPGREGKKLSAVEISSILDSNPSYIELCEKIESYGIPVDRPKFAKGLLAAVPEIDRTKSSAGLSISTVAAPLAAPTQSATTTTTMSSAVIPLADAANRLMSGSALSKPSPSGSNDSTAPYGKSVSPLPPSSMPTRDTIQPTGVIDPRLEGLDAVKQFVDGAWVPDAPPDTPSTKSGKARRPSKVSSRPSEPPRPATKQDLARKKNFADLIDLTQGLSSDEESQPPKKLDTEQQHPIQLPTPPQTTHDMSVQSISLATTQAPHSGPSNSLPTGQPHSTPVHQTPGLPGNHLTRSISLVQPLDKYKAIRRSKYDPKTIARDVLLACGRHPNMRHLNAHLDTLKQVFGPQVDNHSDLSTFRWDVADPGGPAPGTITSTTQRALSSLQKIEADDEASEQDIPSLSRPHARQPVAADGPSGPEFTPLSQPMRQKGVVRKRRGRPPKSQQDGAGEPESGDPSRSGQPGGQGSSVDRPAKSSAVSGYAALRAVQQAQGLDVPKKKGRPVGWRKWMMKDGSSPSQPPTSTKKKSPEPEYQIYKCEWKDCGAELHNLKTLRTHLQKVHCKQTSRGIYECRWTNCGKVVKSGTSAESGRESYHFVREEFATQELWNSHIEKKHLTAIAWRLGDGPRGGLSDKYESELSDSYMSDSHGRQVTPIVAAPERTQAESSGQKRQKMSKDEMEAEDILRAEENRRKAIGPAVDRDGATLATEQRRERFLDDKEIEEVIQEDI